MSINYKCVNWYIGFNYNIKPCCKVRKKIGNLCNLITGPGEILAIRQTINLDVDGRPVLETYELENGGKCIDENGTWLIDVPLGSLSPINRLKYLRLIQSIIQ